MLEHIANIFFNNIQVGYNTGIAAVIGSKITEQFPISQYPFTNRALDVGFCNWLGDEFISPFSFSSFEKGPSENFLYRGIVQSNKWHPNFYIQSLSKDNYKESTFKPFYVILTGMTTFFTIGAIDSAISDPYTKLEFTLAASAAITSLPYYDNYNQTTISAKKAVYFSPQDSHFAQIGLIASHAFVDITKILHLNGYLKKYTTLPQLTAITYCVVEGYNLVYEGQTISGIANNLFFDASRVAAFTLAKAVGVTLVEIAKNIPEIASSASSFALETVTAHPYASLAVAGLSFILTIDENQIDYLGTLMIDRGDFEF